MATVASNLLGVTVLDVLATDSSNVATFGSSLTNTVLKLFDANVQSNMYLISKSNNTLSITKDTGATNVAINTLSPNSAAALQVQGALFTSNISTYDPSSNLYFNNNNIAGISNITFSGNIYQGDAPFKTSQWNSYTSTSNIYFPYNVAIGTSNPTDITGSTSNLLVVGNAIITGTLSAGSMSISYSGSDQFIADLYQPGGGPAVNRSILTNDSNIANRVLCTIPGLTPGRYLLNVTLYFSGPNTFGVLDTTNWAQIEVYRSSVANIIANGPGTPYRVGMINAINNANEGINMSWIVDIADQINGAFTIVLSGKGHNLYVYARNEQGTGSSFSAVPIKAIGYDQNISVNKEIQMSPLRLSSNIQGSPASTFTVSTYGYFNIPAKQVDVYINGQKKQYIADGNSNNDYTVTYNGINQANYTASWTVTLKTPASVGSFVEISAWPVANASTFYSSGYLYQTINAAPSPWQIINDGGVRVGDKCVIDGDLYVRGSIWGGCNTTGFASGVFATSNTATVINSMSNIIGTLNIIDGAITPSKLNLSSGGNVGIGTATAIQPLHVQGQSLFTSNVIISYNVPQVVLSSTSNIIDTRLVHRGSNNNDIFQLQGINASGSNLINTSNIDCGDTFFNVRQPNQLVSIATASWSSGSGTSVILNISNFSSLLPYKEPGVVTGYYIRIQGDPLSTVFPIITGIAGSNVTVNLGNSVSYAAGNTVPIWIYKNTAGLSPAIEVNGGQDYIAINLNTVLNCRTVDLRNTVLQNGTLSNTAITGGNVTISSTNNVSFSGGFINFNTVGISNFDASRLISVSTAATSSVTLGNPLQSNSLLGSVITLGSAANTVLSNTVDIGNTLINANFGTKTNTVHIGSNAGDVYIGSNATGSVVVGSVMRPLVLAGVTNSIILTGVLSSDTSLMSSGTPSSAYTYTIRAPFAFRVSANKVPVFYMSTPPDNTSNPNNAAVVCDILRTVYSGGGYTPAGSIYSQTPRISALKYSTTDTTAPASIPGTLISTVNINEGDLLRCYVSAINGGPLTAGAGLKVIIYNS